MKNISLSKRLKLASEPFQKTKTSEIYKAVIESNDNDMGENALFYAVKAMKKEIPQSGHTMLNEMRITHMIENMSSVSVLIPILMVCDDEENNYAIMQFKKNGKFLNELIYELELKYGISSIPIEYQLSLMKKILSSLYHIHHCMKNETGFLHLDIQPCNIFVENINLEKMKFGTIKYIDFQNAKMVDLNGNLLEKKSEYMINYTEGYSAPEILETNDDNVHYGTDLYSVAAIFYRMLTGIEFTNVELIEEIELPGLSILEYQIKKMLNCCLDHNVKYRYDDTRMLIKEIEQMQTCLEAYRNNYYYDLFCNAYRNWIPQKEILAYRMNFNRYSYHLSVDKLSDDLIQNGIDIKRCDYIFAALWKLKEEYSENIEKRDIYALLSDGISLSNHLGYSTRGIALYKELNKYKNQIPILEYIRINNRIAVIYSDHYDFDKAYKCMIDNVRSLELIKETYRKIAISYDVSLEEATAVYDLAKSYSAIGCYMALLHLQDPMVYFRKAIKEFGCQAGNISITWSHIMHYAIQMEDGSGRGKSLYEQYAYEYFEHEENFEKRYVKARELLRAKDKPNAYPMWIFMKSLLYFYQEKFDGKLFETVKEDFYGKKFERKNEYPMLLIYRYIAQLVYYKNGNKVDALVIDAFEKSLSCCDMAIINEKEPLNIIMCINYDTRRIYNQILETGEQNVKLVYALLDHAKKSGWKRLADILEKTKTLEGLLNFEYC